MKKNNVENVIINENISYAVEYSTEVFLVGDPQYDSILQKWILDNDIDMTARLIIAKDEGYSSSIFKNIEIKNANIKKSSLFFITSMSVEENKEIFKMLTSIGIVETQIIPSGYFLPPIIAEYYGYYSYHHKAYTIPLYASFDLVDTCNLQCSTCMRSINRGSASKMDESIFYRCLDKLCKIGINTVEMHKSTEPFLHPKIVEFCQNVKKRNMNFIISTNLSLKNIGIKAKMVADMIGQNDIMVVTISALSQNIYEINHNGGSIDNVKENLKILATTSGNRNNIILRMLKFDYNHGEIPKVVSLANELGINYQIMPALGDPRKGVLAIDTTEMLPYDIELNDYSDLFHNLRPCSWLFEKSILIKCDGNVHLCCNVDPIEGHDLGPFLEQDFTAIQVKRYMHPLCGRCIHNHKILSDNSVENNNRIKTMIHDGMDALALENDLKLTDILKDHKLQKVTDWFLGQFMNNVTR